MQLQIFTSILKLCISGYLRLTEYDSASVLLAFVTSATVKENLILNYIQRLAHRKETRLINILVYDAIQLSLNKHERLNSVRELFKSRQGFSVGLFKPPRLKETRETSRSRSTEDHTRLYRATTKLAEIER